MTDWYTEILFSSVADEEIIDYALFWKGDRWPICFVPLFAVCKEHPDTAEVDFMQRPPKVRRRFTRLIPK